MVKLQSTDQPSSVFYFKTMQDCETFMYVFKDHWCNVRWNKPIEKTDFPEMEKYQRRNMNKDPKERAESSLSWGFNLCKRLGTELNDYQNAFVSAMVDNMSLSQTLKDIFDEETKKTPIKI